MMETTAVASSAPSFPIGISPADLALGQEVDVESRTWAGINKPGGHATVIKIHADEHGMANRVDVKYVLGGRELDVELTYVKAHVELSRGSRGRRRDVKMNLGTLGGTEKRSKKIANKKGANKKGRDKDRGGAKKKAPSSPTKSKKGGHNSKKRKALASLDVNGGNKAKAAKKSKKEDAGEESSKNDAKVAKKNSNKVGEKELKTNTDVDGNGSDKGAMVAKRSTSSTSTAEEEESSAGCKAIKARKKSSNKTEEVGISKNDGADVAVEETYDGKWTLIQDGKSSDYVAALQKGTRVSYWWSDEDGWLPGTISKELAKVVTPSTIKWTIKVDFDNGDRHALSFHPREKRWKFLKSGEENVSADVAAVKEPAKKKQASEKKSASKRLAPEKKSASKQPTKPVGEKTEAAKPKVARRIRVEKDDKAKAVAKSSAAMNSITAESFSVRMVKEVTGKKENKATAATKSDPKNTNPAQSFSASKSNAISQTNGGDDPPPALSFGAHLRSKIKEISSKLHDAAAPAKVTPAGDTGDGLVRYSPNSILAVRAAHARSPAPPASRPLSTASIGYSSSLPRGTLSPEEKKRGLSWGMEERAARTAAVQVSLIRPPPPRAVAAKQSKGSMGYAESLEKASSGERAQRTMMQSLYKSECAKAEKFVNFMTGNSSKTNFREKSASAVALSLLPDSEEDDDLELKMDQGRMETFNSFLTEIMFRVRVDTMYVEEILEKVNRNADLSKKKPFTLLEIKPYLQKLHDESRIFLTEEEGTMVIYAI